MRFITYTPLHKTPYEEDGHRSGPADSGRLSVDQILVIEPYAWSRYGTENGTKVRTIHDAEVLATEPPSILWQRVDAAKDVDLIVDAAEWLLKAVRAEVETPGQETAGAVCQLSAALRAFGRAG